LLRDFFGKLAKSSAAARRSDVLGIGETGRQHLIWGDKKKMRRYTHITISPVMQEKSRLPF